jgi:hypothetical protein
VVDQRRVGPFPLARALRLDAHSGLVQYISKTSPDILACVQLPPWPVVSSTEVARGEH